MAKLYASWVSTERLIGATVLGLGLTLAPSLAHAVDFGSDNQGCAVSEPCFSVATQVGNRILFRFDQIRGWDFYNVRFAKAGGGEAQLENRSGSFTINNVLPNRRYTIAVQGCHSHLLGRSDCTRWVEQSVTTK